MSGRRALVAGIGNVLRGDDGFGPAVLEALGAAGAPAGVRLLELGIGGMHLVQELLDGYDALVIVDATDRGEVPGTLWVLEPQVPDPESIPPDERRGAVGDAHRTTPGPALLMARAAGALPPYVRLVGCQPGETGDCSEALSPPVAAAVPAAAETVRRLLREAGVAMDRETPRAGSAALGEVAWRDQILQAMFWLGGEGLGEEVGPGDLARLLDAPPEEIERHMRRLVHRGELAPVDRDPGRFRLTETGREEGGRRFADEFAGMEPRGHYQCDDDCWCHDPARAGEPCPSHGHGH